MRLPSWKMKIRHKQVPRLKEDDKVIARDYGGYYFWEGVIVEIAANHIYGVKNDLGNIRYFNVHDLKVVS